MFNFNVTAAMFLLLPACRPSGQEIISPGESDIIPDNELNDIQKIARSGDASSIKRLVTSYYQQNKISDARAWEEFGIQKRIPYFMIYKANYNATKVNSLKNPTCKSIKTEMIDALDLLSDAYFISKDRSEKASAIEAYFRANRSLLAICLSEASSHDWSG